MPKRVIQDICDTHKITRDILNAAVTEGVNKWDDAEVEAWLANRRGRIDSKAEDHPGPQNAATFDFTGLTLPETADKLQLAILNEANHREIAALKNKITGVKELIRIQVELSHLIPLGEIRERDTRIANAVRSALIKLENDLPPKGVGLDEAGMQKAFRPVIRTIMDDLAEAQSDFWKDKKEVA